MPEETPIPRKFVIYSEEMHLTQLIKINLEKAGHQVWSSYHYDKVEPLLKEHEANTLVLDGSALGAKDLIRSITADADLFAIKIVVLERQGFPKEPPGGDVYLTRGPMVFWQILKQLG